MAEIRLENAPTKEELYARLEELSIAKDELAPDEITIREYSNHNGCSYDVAKNRIDKLVERGILKFKEKRVHRGATTNIWLLTNKPD